jgi:hypothetical protein
LFHEEQREVKDELICLVALLVSFLCGALGGARPITPQRRESKQAKPTLPSILFLFSQFDFIHSFIQSNGEKKR